MGVAHKCLAGCTVAASLLAGCVALLGQQSGQPAPGPGDKNKAAAPAPKPPASTADDNPFPEEESKAAQKQATAADQADRAAAASGSVDGAPADGSSSRDKLAGIDILGDHDARIANGAGGVVRDPKLAAQDIKVGQQYFGMGDFEGAYQRFKEACEVNPDNVDAVFFLAEAARKTAHLDESAENYKIYLQAQPEGPHVKAARKALAQLEGK